MPRKTKLPELYDPNKNPLPAPPKSEADLRETLTRCLLFELSGFFRKNHQSPEEGIAEAMEKMLLIGSIWGSRVNPTAKEMAVREIMNLAHIPERYAGAILEALKSINP